MSDLAYAAHTRTATFYLDADGVCQRVDLTSEGARDAERCIGAQYVASLDVTEPGGLVGLPREGASMLFVVADAHMRYSLVRTAVVERFETLGVAEPKTIPAPAPELELDSDDLDDALPEITITWPSAEVLARGLPLPAIMRTPLLAPPPRPARHALDG